MHYFAFIRANACSHEPRCWNKGTYICWDKRLGQANTCWDKLRASELASVVLRGQVFLLGGARFWHDSEAARTQESPTPLLQVATMGASGSQASTNPLQTWCDGA